jgi:Na+-translocating ferredoxin:NAD+ oxidoreductase RnfC subunit
MRYEQQKPLKVHPIKEGRRVPLKQLMKRIDVLKYDAHTPFIKNSPEISKVKILLKQHIGINATPVVKLGESVNEGSLIADIENGKLGAKIHSSITGRVTHVSDEFIKIEK